MQGKVVWLMGLAALVGLGGCAGEMKSVVGRGAEVEKLAGGFSFTEGPAADAEGNVYFTDIPNNRIHKWSVDGKLTTFMEDSGGANGLFFDKEWNLIACEGGRRRLVSIGADGKVTVLADEYKGKKFNSLNDLWVDPKGGVYFTDPVYGQRGDLEMDGEHVYYLSAGGASVIRVIEDMVKPNGVIGTPDGKMLYVTDHGGDKTFVYDVIADGKLRNKRLFAAESSDGMTIDERGNIYLTVMPSRTLKLYDTAANPVAVYNPAGEKIATIEIPERPSNVCFGGKDGKTLFITAQKSLYSVRMRVSGVKQQWR